MPFERALTLSSLFLAGVALAGLALAHSVPAWLGLFTGSVLTLAALEAAGLRLSRWDIRRIGGGSTVPNFLLIGAFVLFLFDLVVISRDLLSAGIHFLVLLLGIKLLSLNERRDLRHVFAISLMAVLAAASLTTEVWFVPIFVLFVMAAVWTLLLYHLTDDRAFDAAGIPSSSTPSTRNPATALTARFFWLTNGVVIATFILTLSIFFLLPRIGAGLLQKARGEGLKTTGFSERVDLGTIGSVKQDPQVVMRVELPDLPDGMERLYLRGVAYDRYSGRSWSTGAARRRNLSSIGDGTFLVRPDAGRDRDDTVSVQQDILLEALDTAVLFAAPFPEYLSGDLSGLQADSMAGLHLPFPSSSRVRYSVVSRQPHVRPGERTSAAVEYPRSVLERYLQLPELSDKVAELSRQVVQNAGTPYERILAIQNHLLGSYRYSLDMETATSLHPLEDFLFTRKTGYCEHYATAMTLMLRTVGIPARLVTGFLATEWNEFGGYFTVRQRDAHAWVEVYFPQSGWITFDPTPATGAAPVRSVLDAFLRMTESMRLYWDRLFIRYSIRDQLAVVHGMREGSDALRDQMVRWAGGLAGSAGSIVATLTQAVRGVTAAPWSLSAILAGLGLLTSMLIIRKVRSLATVSRHTERRRQLRITGLYKSMLQTLAGRGLAKSPSVTATEFARLVAAEWEPAGAVVVILTNLYCRARFGSAALTSEELAEAERHLRSLQQLSRTAS